MSSITLDLPHLMFFTACNLLVSKGEIKKIATDTGSYVKVLCIYYSVHKLITI